MTFFVISESFFGLKLIILRSELNVATFCFCIDATFFSMSRFKNFNLKILRILKSFQCEEKLYCKEQ